MNQKINQMSVRSLCVLMLSFSTIASAEKAYPCLTLLNKTNNILTIKHDPNLDDQTLVVNGKKHST